MSTEPSRGKGKSPASKAEESSGDRLPFEPRQKRKKNVKAKPEPAPDKATASKEAATASPKKDKPKAKAASKESMAIPDVVSKRMVRRMALLCGIPTVLGISTFFVSYFLVTKFGLKLPNVAVVLVSMGFFGLGVLGLSYGVISASWDEDVPGTTLGWQEFTTNWGRLTSAWRSERQKD